MRRVKLSIITCTQLEIENNMSGTDSAQDEGLIRVIGTGAVGLSVVNMVVGAGIFALPGIIAKELGT
jgi:hypothetical protein